MRKKILVAEKSDAIRSIAESILHQNGYDVITASTIEKAKELIITARPNMVIIGADMRDANEVYLYDSLDENKDTSSIPILLIADPEGRSLPYPDEVILPRPFDPKDFLDRVKLFVGGGIEEEPEEKLKTVEPLSMDAVDDEFLDAALGIDQIEVEESEIMHKTNMNLEVDIKSSTSKEDLFEIHRPEDKEKEGLSDSDKVESLMIRDDDAPDEKPKNVKSSTSSKLEIAPDQYGLIESEEDHSKNIDKSNADHDYDWFIKEMQKEATNGSKAVETPSDDDGELKTRPTSESLEPVNIPETEISEPVESESDAQPAINPGGVDGFITEFKKEAEQISSEPCEPTVSQASQEKSDTSVAVAEDTPSEPQAGMDEVEIHHFVNNLVEVMSEKLAKKIIDKIDKEELYQIIKDDLANILNLKQSEK